MSILCVIGIHRWPAWSAAYLEKTNIINDKTGRLFYVRKEQMQRRVCRGCNLIQKRNVI